MKHHTVLSKSAWVGDSRLPRIDADKISNNHHVAVLNAKSGLKFEEAANHVYCEADVMILHVGTGNMHD